MFSKKSICFANFINNQLWKWQTNVENKLSIIALSSGNFRSKKNQKKCT